MSDTFYIHAQLPRLFRNSLLPPRHFRIRLFRALLFLPFIAYRSEDKTSIFSERYLRVNLGMLTDNVPYFLTLRIRI